MLVRIVTFNGQNWVGLALVYLNHGMIILRKQVDGLSSNISLHLVDN